MRGRSAARFIPAGCTLVCALPNKTWKRASSQRVSPLGRLGKFGVPTKVRGPLKAAAFKDRLKQQRGAHQEKIIFELKSRRIARPLVVLEYCVERDAARDRPVRTQGGGSKSIFAGRRGEHEHGTAKIAVSTPDICEYCDFCGGLPLPQ